MGEAADSSLTYIDTMIRALGVFEAAGRLKPIPHNRCGHTLDYARRRKGYVFVSCVPRSGTTALGELLNLSDDIALLVELVNPRVPYSAASFESGFVRQVNKTTSNREKTDLVLEKYDQCAYVGDKSPLFHFRVLHRFEYSG